MKRFGIQIWLMVILMAGCKSVQSDQASIHPLPEKYFSGGADSSNLAITSWREYFSDAALINLIDTALTTNPDLFISLQRIEQAKASVQHAQGQLLPVGGGGGSGALRRFGLHTMDGAGNSTTEILPDQIVPVNLPDFYIGLQTSWEADVTGKLRNRKRAAVSRYLASVEGKNWLVTGLVAEVAYAYYDLQALDREHQIILENIAIQENAISIVSAQKAAGATNELAVKQFQNQLLSTRSLEFQVAQEIIEAESRLNLLLGRYPQVVNRDETTFEKPIPAQIQPGFPSQLLRLRPDVRQAELELLASKADVKAARAAFYPSLNISGGLGYQAFKTSLLLTSPESLAFSIVGGLSAPLINRSAIKSQFKLANAYQVETLYNYQKTVMIAFSEVHNELKRIEILQQVGSYRNEQVEISGQVIEASNELFRTGRATNLEVLIAQENALNARLEAIEIKRQQLHAQVNIYRALGGGWR